MTDRRYIHPSQNEGIPPLLFVILLLHFTDKSAASCDHAVESPIKEFLKRWSWSSSSCMRLSLSASCCFRRRSSSPWASYARRSCTRINNTISWQGTGGCNVSASKIPLLLESERRWFLWLSQSIRKPFRKWPAGWPHQCYSLCEFHW